MPSISYLGLALIQISPPALLENVSVRSIVLAAATFALAWILVRWNTKLFNVLAKRSTRGRFLFKRIEPISRMLIWFQASYLAMLMLAPSREAFLALIASVGIAIGLGAQDLVKSVIGGLVVLIDRPYQIGDRVRIGDAYGEIDHIGLRSTKLTTPDDTRVTIPNSEILTGLVYNANSGVPDCQVVTDIVIPHDMDPELAVRLGYESAYSSPYLLPTKPVVVLLLDQFAERPYCILRIKAYVYDHRSEPRMQSDITVRLKTELLRRNILQDWNRAGSVTGDRL
jgi:small-conductance mechanosensitive channel